MELRVAAITNLPWSRVITKEINGKNETILEGDNFMHNIIKSILQKLQFNYTLSHASSWGTKDQTAKSLKFNGMVGLLQNDQVDLALGPFTIERGDRDLVADPSAIVLEDTNSILSSGESDVSKGTFGVLSLTQSFETHVWYSIFLTLLIIILLSSSVHYIWSEKSNETSYENVKNFIKVLIRNSFKYSSNLMKQYHESNSRNLPEIFNYCWKINSSLLIFFYLSMILAHLIASNKKSIDTFVDLSNSQVIPTATLGSANEVIIREGKTDELRRIYSQMIKYGLQNCFILFERILSDEIMDDVLSGKRALMAPLSYYKIVLSERVKNKRRCGFHLSESEVNYEPNFMLYNKKFNKKLKEKIDFRLLEIFERKAFHWKVDKYYLGYKDCLAKKAKSQWKPLILFNIRGLLLVCVTIITMAFVLLFMEKINYSF